MIETRQDPIVAAVIARCNQRLRDALGIAPSGDQRFKWVWGPDLSVFVKPDPLGETIRANQVEGNVWVLAQWLKPPPLAQWEAQLGKLIPYPANGRYRATDVLLFEGKLPTDELTYWAIHQVRETDAQTLAQLTEQISAARDKKERDFDAKAEDLVNDRWTNTVPGSKAHISYPGKTQ